MKIDIDLKKDRISFRATIKFDRAKIFNDFIADQRRELSAIEQLLMLINVASNKSRNNTYGLIKRLLEVDELEIKLFEKIERIMSNRTVALQAVEMGIDGSQMSQSITDELECTEKVILHTLTVSAKREVIAEEEARKLLIELEESKTTTTPNKKILTSEKLEKVIHNKFIRIISGLKTVMKFSIGSKGSEDSIEDYPF